MKLDFLFIATVFTVSALDNPYGNWKPAGPNGVRGPCPMLNTLANHGFLPHNGKDITENDTVSALGSALNFDEEISRLMHKFAVSTNPAPNATTYSLNHLSRHNILEHDASLSRADAYFADPAIFNQTVFDQTRSYWKGPIVNLKEAVRSRLARLETSNATNPTFTLSALGKTFGLGEIAAYLAVLGDIPSATAIKARLVYFFENERLPVHLGWTKLSVLSKTDFTDMLQRVANATEKVSGEAVEPVKRDSIIGLHATLSE
ncbi:Chloroperoxidase [Hypoxylon trugodes]|uniref:Chloroperoxidase n=1 Tax=Hypoxylon trugodes TaxID=326681 RepID=UPI002199B44F|nr:Chloroperoxidase [Hypoxylon trugodes]KAI1386677.1 Chloroperoxidase [Hypoxylon trugodes]